MGGNRVGYLILPNSGMVGHKGRRRHVGRQAGPCPGYSGGRGRKVGWGGSGRVGCNQVQQGGLNR